MHANRVNLEKSTRDIWKNFSPHEGKSTGVCGTVPESILSANKGFLDEFGEFWTEERERG